MSEHLINDDELTAVDERLHADAAGWRIDPPADLHERTMSALVAARREAPAVTAAGGPAPSGGIGRVPHGMALAAASLALLITTWAALVLQSPPAPIEPQGMGNGSGQTAQAPDGVASGADLPENVVAPTGPLADLLAAASLESEIAALETDARTISAMMTRQVRLISNPRR
jgi:hypothetical protein